MYYPRSISANLYYVGGVDRRLERFENLFALPEGISYNAFLWKGAQNVLLDAVDASVSELYFEAVEQVLDGADLHYLIANHVEPDHCASINFILERYPNCKLLTSKKGFELLQQFYRSAYAAEHLYNEQRVQLVGADERLVCGDLVFRFLPAPNVHWPEVMLTYEETTQTLFSADAFGSFKAPAGYLFADEVNYNCEWLNEARRYYCNIVGRQGAAVQRLFARLADLEIKMICPLHGLLFREPKSLALILEKYQKWSLYEPEEQGAVIIYSSMYGNSQQLSDCFAALLAEQKVPEIRVYDVSKTDVSILIADCFRFSNIIFCCNTYNTELYPKMDALLRELIMLNWDKHSVSFLANQSWGGRGVEIAQEILSKAKNTSYVGSTLRIKSSLACEQLLELRALAEAVQQDMATHDA